LEEKIRQLREVGGIQTLDKMATVPAVHLSLLVLATEAHHLSLLGSFVEQSRTPIGRVVKVSLHSPNGPAASELIRQIGALGVPFEGQAQIDSRDYLIAGDGNQTSMVEAWAATPAEMALPPLRCDGSVDLARLRQWEWHTGFLAQVRAKMGGEARRFSPHPFSEPHATTSS
jgi:hypothetical protein